MPTKQVFKGNSIDFNQGGDFLNRPRLRKLLKNAVNYPLVAVYAGSGYGKTRAVYSFLQGYSAYSTWLQITESDNSETHFWENYSNAVSVSWPEVGARLLENEFPNTNEAFAKFIVIVQDITNVPGKHILVLDNFHLLKNPTVLLFIEKTVAILPSNAAVITISRTAPKINLIGMMLHERIFSIHEDALCFTEDEIAEYFSQLTLSVTRQNIREIYEETQGWAFAINLIGRTLRKTVKYERYALEAMKTNIFKLIETEISRNVSEPLWRFILRISLVDHLAASLIKLLEKDDELIMEMELLDAYIRYDFYLDAYIVHPLLLDYLRQNNHILTDEEKRKTYQEAGAWCEDNNYLVDAMSYYEKSEDYANIIRIVSSLKMQESQEIARYALEVFDRAPEDAVLHYPLFPVMYIRLRISLGLLDEASELAEKYAGEYEARSESPEKYRTLMGIYSAQSVLRLVTSTYTNVFDFDAYFEKQREYYEKNPHMEPNLITELPAGDYASYVGTSYTGAPEKYIEALSRSILHAPHVLNGNMYGLDDLARGELCFLRRETNSAEQHLKRALNKARVYKQYDIQSLALIYLLRIDFLNGDLDNANATLRTIEELLHETSYANRYVSYDIACGLYYLTLNQLEQVPNWLKEAFTQYINPVSLDNYANRVKAQYHYQARKYSALLAYISSERERQTLLFGKIVSGVLEALSHYQLKHRNEAIAALTEVCNLAEPNSIIVPFIQHGNDMRAITAFALKDDSCQIHKPWLEDINRKASAYAKRRAHLISKYMAANSLDKGISLTKREIEVIKDLSQGLSRAEIASSQSISINTVKMVINRIYDKLRVNSIVEVIRIALDNKII
jgi:LuxR family maltose regulon positive regulatory protein